MLDVTKSLPEDPAELRAFTALLLAEVRSQAVLIAKLRHQLAGQRAHRYSGGMHAPFHGLQANHCRATDGYVGFEDLYRNGTIREVACMAHVRRKFVPSWACKHALPGNGCA